MRAPFREETESGDLQCLRPGSGYSLPLLCDPGWPIGSYLIAPELMHPSDRFSAVFMPVLLSSCGSLRLGVREWLLAFLNVYDMFSMLFKKIKCFVSHYTHYLKPWRQKPGLFSGLLDS